MRVTAPHQHARHPHEVMAAETTAARVVATWLADHLAILFGATTTVWLFLVIPLAILAFPASWQQIVFYLASAWIQLWALPLLTYQANKADAVRTAKADVDHAALTAVHHKLDALVVLASGQDARLALIETHLGIAEGK